MPLSILFWPLAFSTAAFVFAHIFMGYNLLNIILIFLVLDLFILEFNRKAIHKKINSDIKDVFSIRLENIEKSLMNIVGALGTGQPQPAENANQILEDHKSAIKNDLDMIARKSIDIENRLTMIKRDFSVLLSSFNERIRKLEESTSSTESGPIQ